MRTYRLPDYDFDLPPELIAQVPAPTRSASRLLHVSGTRLADLAFTDLPRLVAPGDLLIRNDTRVVKSRLYATKPTGGAVELLLERILAPDEAIFQLRASHPPRPGSCILLPARETATVLERNDRFFRLRLENRGAWLDHLEQYGKIPLPPYIERAPGTDDETRYQTVYAREPGAVAAPTAGLHFDENLLAQLAAIGIETASVTLHVGAGTFAPMQSDDISQHRMHSERYSVPEETIAAIRDARARGGRILAVGTTTLRALESATDEAGNIAAGEAETSLFVQPGYRFHIVDRLLTNFHLPKSSLLVLVSAFAGYEPIIAAYAHAIRQRYRFFSYGDAMLLERDG